MIDKEKFGAFVAELRKEKGMTQKELAEKLFLSDKAISKWERGLSMPDIAILTPLAEVLEVSVAELLNCQRMEKKPLESDKVDELVQRAIALNEEESQPPWRHWQNWLILLCTWLVVGMEWIALQWMKHDVEMMKFEMGTFLLLSAIFGVWVWLLVQEKLPRYYDENQIRYYHHNGFKMNLPGVNLNNSNWPHIVKALRAWCVYLPISVPVLYGIGHEIENCGGIGITIGANMSLVMAFLLLWTLLSLFVPLIYIGKKYE